MWVLLVKPFRKYVTPCVASQLPKRLFTDQVTNGLTGVGAGESGNFKYLHLKGDLGARDDTAAAQNWKDYETLLTELAPGSLSSIVHTADGSSFLVDLVNHQPLHVDFEGADYQNWDFLHELRSRMDLFQDLNNKKQPKTNRRRRIKEEKQH